MSDDQFFSYQLLPWEVNNVEEYAQKSCEKFKYAYQLKDAFIGAASEFAFTEMLKPDIKSMIKEWSNKDGETGNPYDFLFDNGFGKEVRVDIKSTGSYNKYVPTPDKCNFWYSKPWFDQKRERNIQLSDIFIQFFYDIQSNTAYFIGALSLSQIFSLEKTRKLYNDGFKICREEMDLTNKWTPYLINSSN